MLFVDSPVGTGFSEVGGPDAYSRTVRSEKGRERGREKGREGGDDTGCSSHAHLTTRRRTWPRISTSSCRGRSRGEGGREGGR